MERDTVKLYIVIFGFGFLFATWLVLKILNRVRKTGTKDAKVLLPSSTVSCHPPTIVVRAKQEGEYISPFEVIFKYYLVIYSLKQCKSEEDLWAERSQVEAVLGEQCREYLDYIDSLDYTERLATRALVTASNNIYSKGMVEPKKTMKVLMEQAHDQQNAFLDKMKGLSEVQKEVLNQYDSSLMMAAQSETISIVREKLFVCLQEKVSKVPQILGAKHARLVVLEYIGSSSIMMNLLPVILDNDKFADTSLVMHELLMSMLRSCKECNLTDSALAEVNYLIESSRPLPCVYMMRRRSAISNLLNNFIEDFLASCTH